MTNTLDRLPLEELRLVLEDGRLTATELQVLRVRLRAQSKQVDTTTPASVLAWRSVGKAFANTGTSIKRSLSKFENETDQISRTECLP